MNLGDKLNKIVNDNKSDMFEQAELATLTYHAYDFLVGHLKKETHEEYTLTFPIGYGPDKRPMTYADKLPKDEIINKYEHLAQHQLSINVVVQLVTIVENMLNDLLRAIIVKYPNKLGSKRTITVQAALESATIEELHIKAVDTYLNEISYKSPAEYNDFWMSLTNINLMECTAFHKYLEIKATRDIYIHNSGIANEIYLKKSGSHARVKSGIKLHVDNDYYLESYEACLRIADWIEKELHDHWHSLKYEQANEKKAIKNNLEPETNIGKEIQKQMAEVATVKEKKTRQKKSSNK